jgi:hypothetical protein
MTDRKKTALTQLRKERSLAIARLVSAQKKTDDIAAARIMVAEREVASLNERLRRYTQRT